MSTDKISFKITEYNTNTASFINFYEKGTWFWDIIWQNWQKIAQIWNLFFRNFQTLVLLLFMLEYHGCRIWYIVNLTVYFGLLKYPVQLHYESTISNCFGPI